MIYIALFAGSLIISLLLVPQIKKSAFHFGAIDHPNADRKIHKAPIPLLGGFIIYISFTLLMAAYVVLAHPDMHIVPLKFYGAMTIGGLILMIGGFLDDRYDLKPLVQVIFPALAVLTLIIAGIGVGITQLSNPFGNPININFMFIGIHFSAVFIFLFVMGMIYTTKFLDGMDGLAGGISFIASLTLFFLSLTPKINQSVTASLCIILCGAILGFLIYNFHPATIFLGESGSTYLGFILGSLSVLLGGKIAIAVLVMGIPIMDVAWVIVRRIWYGVSPFKADRKHLHFRLLDIGFSQRRTVLILYAIAVIFGLVAIFLQSLGKLIALVILLCVMLFLGISSVMVYKSKVENAPAVGPEPPQEVDQK